jgi:hypothetical protein
MTNQMACFCDRARLRHHLPGYANQAMEAVVGRFLGFRILSL